MTWSRRGHIGGGPTVSRKIRADGPYPPNHEWHWNQLSQNNALHLLGYRFSFVHSLNVSPNVNSSSLENIGLCSFCKVIILLSFVSELEVCCFPSHVCKWALIASFPSVVLYILHRMKPWFYATTSWARSGNQIKTKTSDTIPTDKYPRSGRGPEHNEFKSCCIWIQLLDSMWIQHSPDVFRF